MCVAGIDIDHVKLLRDFRPDLREPSDQPRMWTVLVGESGRCTTTVLRCHPVATGRRAGGPT